MSRRSLFFLSLFFTALFAFGIPFEHKYDKLFRFFSLTLIPEGLCLPPWFDKKIYFYISDITTLFLTFVAFYFFRSSFKRFFLDKGACFLWMILFCALISIIASPLSSYPIPYFRLWQLVTPILLYCFFSQNFSKEESSQLTHVFMITLFFTASVEAVITIAQYFKQAPLGLRFLGELNPISFFHHPNARRWIFDLILPETSVITRIWRPSGTFPHTNVLAGFLSVSLLVSYSFIMTSKRKYLFCLLFIPQFFAMILTYSRSALFGWIVGTLVWIGFYLFHHGLRKTVTNLNFRLIGWTILFSSTLTTTLLYEQIFSRGGIFNYNELAKGSDTTRLYYQEIALRMIKDKPLTGVGYSELTLRTPEYLPPNKDPKRSISGTHNIYLFLAAETGLISLAAFLLFIFFLLKAALQTPFTNQFNSLLAIFAAFLFIGCCDFYPILFQQGKLLFFGLAGLLAAQSSYNPFLSRKNERALSH